MGEDGTTGRVVGGRYRLLRRIGRGGMGAVWAAHDDLLDREVAVKEVVPPPGLDAAERDRLHERTLREARAAARIRSGTAVTVYDVVDHDGQPYVVMELLPSRSLADVLREEGPLPADAAARVGLRLLEALAAAHAAAVLHRDVKPANVLFDARGEAVLTDFGIATLEGDPSVTTTGAIIGSPGYVAPERAHGEAPTPAADLWSLGVTLATAVHGRNPFERETPLATMMAAVQAPLPDAVAAGPLGTVLVGLLQKDPSRRLGPEEARRLLEAVASVGPDATAPLPEGGGLLPLGSDGPVAAGAAPSARGAERTQALRPVPPEPAAPRAAGDRGPAAVAAGTGPAPTGPPRRRAVLVPLLVLLAVAVAGAVAVAALLDGAGDPGVAAPATSGPPASASGRASAPAPSGTGSSPAPSAPASTQDTPEEDQDTPAGTGDGDDGRGDSEGPDDAGRDEDRDDEGPGRGRGRGGDDDAALAPGLEAHEDEAYTVGVPEGWTVETDGDTRTRFRDPASRRYLLVEEGGTPSGDPVADWEAQEPVVAERLDGYELIGIERADFGDLEAADWQFTWEPGGGTVRVLNRNVVDEETEQAFALYWQVPVEEWDDSRALFDAVAASFDPAG